MPPPIVNWGVGTQAFFQTDERSFQLAQPRVLGLAGNYSAGRVLSSLGGLRPIMGYCSRSTT